MHQWYALQSLPRAEAVLVAAMGDWAERWELETYLPMAPTQKRGGKVSTPEPLFPGYVFCRCDLAELPLSLLRRTPGLRSVVTFDRDPAVVPDEAITLLRERVDALSATGGLPSHSFKPGDILQVKSGPLRGLYAVFEGPVKPAQRVRVLLEFLGQANRVSMPPEMLEKVSNPPRRTRGQGRWLPGYGSRA